MTTQATLLLLWALPAARTQAQDPGSGRYMVHFKPETGPEARKRIIQTHGAVWAREMEMFRMAAVRIAGDKDAVSRVLQELRSDPGVIWAVEDVRVAAPGVSGECGEKPPADEIGWNIARVSARWAWPTNQGEGAEICVIDTGIGGHPDLTANVKGSYNAVDPSSPAEDDLGHGTFVAGVIAARLDKKGIVGVAPKARLFAVKVFAKHAPPSAEDVLDGFHWCVRNKVPIINMSLADTTDDSKLIAWRTATAIAVLKGHLIIAAAGNHSGDVEAPARWNGVVSVSAATKEGKLASFSNRGDRIDFIAPGQDIVSACPGGGFRKSSGTSYAAPNVAGMAALAHHAGADGRIELFDKLKSAASTIGLGPKEEGNGMIAAAPLAGR